MTRDDNQGWYTQQGLEMLETLAQQLDRRYSDTFGAEKKAEYQQEIMRVIESFGSNGEIPDGWKCFYAYKQLVLSACLFGQNKIEEGWREFDSALEKYKYIFSLKEKWLTIGGGIFSNLKVSKDWNYAIDEQGNQHKLFSLIRLSFYRMYIIDELLTNEKWAWFNPVRNSEKYREALTWIKNLEKIQEE